ncbi:MAG TPA: DegQ family serine endoprotease [Gammaproteobacteria bacterium]|nr:DegQ family serine endoprotease [Gammaproteobacteria bacterium]
MKRNRVWAGAIALAAIFGLAGWLVGTHTHTPGSSAAFISNPITPAQASSPETAGQPGPDFITLAKDNQAAVVNISTTATVSTKQSHGLPPGIPKDSPFGQFFKHFFGNRNGPAGNGKQKVHSLGSGFIISSDGYILTNAHVVKDADQIVVGLDNRRQFSAKLVGMDKMTDVALLKIDAKNLPTVKTGDSDNLQVGQWVLAIGSPFGFSHSATQGIVSALHRSLPNDTYVPFIQTDVAVNPGNSGGPLIDTAGEVIGINSQIYTTTGGYEGLSFAIPINVAMNVAKQLKSQGHVTRGWLGVYIQPVTQNLAQAFGMNKPSGALVAKVEPDSPASRAGLKAGDVITAYNGHEIQQSSALPPLVANTPIGKTVPVKVLRDGSAKTVQVTIKELKPKEQSQQASTQPGAKHHELNMVVSGLTADQRKKLDVSDGGVLVRQVGKGPAAEAGLRPGDVILMLAGHRVTSTRQFTALVHKLPRNKPVPVLVQRHDNPMFLTLELPAKG